MSAPRHVGHHHRHMVSYPLSLHQRVYSLVLVPLATLVVAFFFLRAFAPSLPPTPVTVWVMLAALGATFVRLLIAYVLALLFAFPLALLVTRNDLAERIFLPMFDIMQSVPVLAFFPVVVAFFVHYALYGGAAIFILFLGMLWNIVFSLVGGMQVIPTEIKAVGRIFGLTRFAYVRKIIFPSVIPYLVTGSLLAWAQGWNIIIVAEVLHTYLPGASTSIDVFGIGSILVHASATGSEGTFLIAIVIMVAAIAALNFFVWQKLLHYAEKYKFE